jgi:hypothetical protein
MTWFERVWSIAGAVVRATVCEQGLYVTGLLHML